MSSKIEVIALGELSSTQTPESFAGNYKRDSDIQVFNYSGPKIDPNVAEFNELGACGLSKFACENIIKYRENGGYFFQLEDLKKIYGIDSDIA